MHTNTEQRQLDLASKYWTGFCTLGLENKQSCTLKSVFICAACQYEDMAQREREDYYCLQKSCRLPVAGWGAALQPISYSFISVYKWRPWSTPASSDSGRTAGPSDPPVPQLPEVGWKKNWRDYFLPLTSYQCGCVHRCHVQRPNYSLQADVKGRCQVALMVQGPQHTHTRTHTHTDQGGLWDFSASLTASAAFDGDLGSSSVWISVCEVVQPVAIHTSFMVLIIAQCCRGEH